MLGECRAREHHVAAGRSRRLRKIGLNVREKPNDREGGGTRIVFQPANQIDSGTGAMVQVNDDAADRISRSLLCNRFVQFAWRNRLN